MQIEHACRRLSAVPLFPRTVATGGGCQETPTVLRPGLSVECLFWSRLCLASAARRASDVVTTAQLTRFVCPVPIPKLLSSTHM